MSASDRVQVLNVPLHPFTAPELLAELRHDLDAGRQAFVVTATNELAVLSHRQEKVAKLLKQADYVVADSTGLVWAAHYLRRPIRGPFKQPRAYLGAFLKLIQAAIAPRSVSKPLPGPVRGSELTLDMAGMCEEFGYRLFLLGAADGVAEAAAARLRAQFPKLQVAGTWSGSPKSGDDAEARQRIKHADAQVVLVAYGQPAQEEWIVRNLPKLQKPLVAIGVGGTFDYLAKGTSVAGGGPAKQPPQLVRKRGFEWLWRLVTQPSRWRRIMTALPVFVHLVVRHRTKT